jgi:hypothetical protein
MRPWREPCQGAVATLALISASDRGIRAWEGIGRGTGAVRLRLGVGRATAWGAYARDDYAPIGLGSRHR